MIKIILSALIMIFLTVGCSTTYWNPLPNANLAIQNGKTVIQYTRQFSVPVSAIYRTEWIDGNDTNINPKIFITAEVVSAAIQAGAEISKDTSESFYNSINSTLRYREDFIIIGSSNMPTAQIEILLKELNKPIFDGQRNPWKN